MVPAGLGWRVGARAVDVVVAGWAFAVLLVEVVDRLPGERTPAGTGALAAGVVIAAEVVPTAASGLTFGKFAFGLRVVSTSTGQAPGWLAAVARALLVWGTAVVTPFPPAVALAVAVVVFAPVLFGAEHRGLHDRLAGTVVVYDRRRGDGPRASA
ncbi:MAG: RDD family protein [Acidimicrobiales bacterium]